MRGILNQMASRLSWAVARLRPARLRLNALRRDAGQLLRLEPVFVASDREGFFAPAHRVQLSAMQQRCAEILRAHGQDAFHLRRFCLCCVETTPMRVDYVSSYVQEGKLQPNWRERLVCPGCGMNNRQRLTAKLVQQHASRSAGCRIYFMEQVTPIYRWARTLPGAEVHGSEYLGPGYQGGERVRGVRHEDAMDLSYPDASFDLIVTNDVMEHIPDPVQALRECFRVLRPGGAVLATFPFHLAHDSTVTRARLVDGRVEHLLPPQYHENPLSPEGSLVFNDFGWDLLDAMGSLGFSAACELYSNDEFGHLGTGLIVFRLAKG